MVDRLSDHGLGLSRNNSGPAQNAAPGVRIPLGSPFTTPGASTQAVPEPKRETGVMDDVIVLHHRVIGEQCRLNDRLGLLLRRLERAADVALPAEPASVGSTNGDQIAGPGVSVSAPLLERLASVLSLHEHTQADTDALLNLLHEQMTRLERFIGFGGAPS
jgi:hypothetical protein